MVSAAQVAELVFQAVGMAGVLYIALKFGRLCGVVEQLDKRVSHLEEGKS